MSGEGRDHDGVRTSRGAGVAGRGAAGSALGARRAVDYTSQDFLPDDDRYDLVFDAVGRAKSSPLKVHAREALTSGGRYVSVDNGMPATTREQLDVLVDLASRGQPRAVIDRSYPLEEVVEANHYVETGHKRGNVILDVTPAPAA